MARYGLVVVGAGIAGLYAALTAAEATDVLVLCRGELSSSNSFYAQGGVAAALADDDDPGLHAEDTLRTGRGICSERAVEVLTREAPARIAHLVELGVRFDEGLGREGGHSRRRIVHAGGAQTGRRIAEVLVGRALDHPRITVREGQRVLAAWIEDHRCVGVLTEQGGVRGDATLIATGGYAALWEPTTNPLGAVGEGIVMAYGVGAEIADLEFVQFHPTAVTGSGFLLSEALRGEGAVLRDDHGERFVDELAERDVVARAIAERGRVGLDLRTIERERFPSLMATLVEDGYDPAAAPIPVSPAAHYSIGGIVTDSDGRTSVAGLFAAGECTCTGVHGANRLASNSLLECLVFGRRAALAALDEPTLEEGSAAPAAELATGGTVSLESRRSMWEHAGLIRSADELEPLREAPLLLSRLLAESALARRESRGAHFRSDFPLADDAFAGHTVQRLGSAPDRAMVVADLVLDERTLARVVERALAEDVGSGDLTTDAIVPADATRRARLLLEQPGVVSGIPVATAVFRALDPDVQVHALQPEGAFVDAAPAPVAEIEGPARALLTGERVALNLVARLCGIATLTRRYVDLVSGTGATILDTRKTTPGLRALEKYAVRCGGGTNHRMGLDDAILIKDNHVRIAGGIVPALAAVRAAGSDRPVEIEADTLEQVEQAVAAGAERILLDNMTPAGVARAVSLVAGRALLEASGGIDEDSIRAYAETGVDFISIGALTHGARSLHVSLEVT